VRRGLAYLLSAVVVVWAAIDVPMPFIEVVPGGATSIAPLVEIGGADVTPVRGELSLLTSRNRHPGAAETVAAWLSPGRELTPRVSVIPAGIESAEYYRLQRRVFERSFRVAAAAGLSQAGLDVRLSTRPIVLSVLPAGPSAGTLESGDVVQSVDGVEVRSGQELVAQLQDIEVGDPVELAIVRAGESRTVTVTAGTIPEVDHPALGITIETLADDVELPVDVSLAETRIGGPSAGLMFALTVYDLVSPDDLTRGRLIAGTGTIDGDGRVGGIGNIPQKMVAASEAGADLVLVPRRQLEQARTAAPPGLEVVGVDSLEDAIEVLLAGS
jgi:PDZ domain-containing protein